MMLEPLTLPKAEARAGEMKAAVISRPGCVEIVAAPLPVAGVGELLIKVESCGVCASNLPRWEGKPWFSYPSAPGELGHEGCGRIVAVGPGVGQRQVGQRVVFLSNHAYAEYDVAKAVETVPVPAELDGAVVLGEPLACALNILDRSGIEPGDTVAVLGIGFLGALLVQLASAAGADVIAFGRRSYARDVAFALGAGEVHDLASESEVIAAAGRFTAGEYCDVVLEATGKEAPLNLAPKLARVRGRVVVAGYHQDGPRQLDMQLWNWKGLDMINAHERDPAVYVKGMEHAMEAVCGGHLQVDPLITHRFGLDDLGEALDLTAGRPPGFMKAVIAP